MLTEEQSKALHEQWNAVHREELMNMHRLDEVESVDDYRDRIFRMLNYDKPEKMENPKGPDWYETLSKEGKRMATSMTLKYKSVPGAINHDRDAAKTIINEVGKGTNWGEKILDRSFENLSDQERKDLNLLLDSYPWADTGKYSKIPNEDFLFGDVSYAVEGYYLALKAKELGIPVDDMPERPEGVLYVEKHGSVKGKMAKQDGGYVRTPAGDKARASVRDKLTRNTDLFSKWTTYDNEKLVDGYKEKILSSVDSMDDRMAELVDRTIDRANATWRDQNGISNYTSGGSIELFMMDLSGNPRSDEDMVATFWHEYGHFVDSWYAKSGIQFQKNPLNSMYDTRDGATMVAIQNRAYKEAAEKDIQSILEMAGLGDKYFAQMQDYGQKVIIKRKSDGAVAGQDPSSPEMWEIQSGIDNMLKDLCGYQEWKNFMKDRGEPQDPDFNDYFECYVTPKRKISRTREKFKGATEAFRKAHEEIREKKDEWIESIGGEEEYRKLLIQREEVYEKYQAKKNKIGNVTDCIDDAVNGEFALCVLWGAHEKDYYQKKVNPIETIANLFSIRATNDSDVVEFMNKVIPNIASVTTKAWRCDWSE